MSPAAAALVLISAVLHVAWNIMGKRDSGNLLFVPLATLAGASVLLPFVFMASDSLFSGSVILLLTATGLFQALYISSLSLSYEHTDISASYPLIRGLPILSVALISALIMPSASLPILGWVGVVVMVLASCLMAQKRDGHTYLTRTALFYIAFAVVGTTGYSLIDSEVMRRISSDLNTGNWDQWIINGLAYASLEGLVSLFWLLFFYVIFYKRLPHRMGRLLMRRNTWLAGGVMLSSYTLILCSMPLVENVSYIVALRQVSIPLSIFAGSLLLGEIQSARRWMSGFGMFIGIMILLLS